MQDGAESVLPSVFHVPAIELAVQAQDISRKKFRDAGNDIFRDAFIILSHDSIIVHRAIGSLCDAGWPAPGGALLRTLVDMNVSALALAHSSNSQLAAFRYLYAGLRRHSRDQGLDAAARRHMFDQIRLRLAMLPQPLRAEAIAAVKDRDRSYWFAPEWSGPSAVIQQFGSKELLWTYMQMSGAAHGTFLGMRIYKENPDGISVNPEPHGRRTLFLDFASCRFLLALVEIRDALEGLALSQAIKDLVERISVAALGPQTAS